MHSELDNFKQEEDISLIYANFRDDLFPDNDENEEIGEEENRLYFIENRNNTLHKMKVEQEQFLFNIQRFFNQTESLPFENQEKYFYIKDNLFTSIFSENSEDTNQFIINMEKASKKEIFPSEKKQILENEYKEKKEGKESSSSHKVENSSFSGKEKVSLCESKDQNAFNEVESKKFRKSEKDYTDIQKEIEKDINRENLLEIPLSKTPSETKTFSEYFNKTSFVTEEHAHKVIDKEEFRLFQKSKKDYSSIYNKKPLIFKKEGKNINRRRKDMKDIMRKRIKSNLYKEVKIILNSHLRSKKIKEISILKKLFDWPQSIITNVTKKENKCNLRKTLEQMLSNGGLEPYTENKKITNPTEKFLIVEKLESKTKNGISNLNILENNKIIINILRNNNINCFDKTFNMTMEEIYKDYLKSDRFEKSIEELIKEGNNYEYIQNYINAAGDILSYYNDYNETIQKDYSNFKKSAKSNIKSLNLKSSTRKND